MEADTQKPGFLAHTTGRMMVPFTELRDSDGEPDFPSVSDMLDLRCFATCCLQGSCGT